MLSFKNQRKLVSHQKKGLRNVVRDHNSQLQGGKRAQNRDYVDLASDPLLNHLSSRRAEKERQHTLDNRPTTM